MLDVHPPHNPIHGAGEFFLHLATITVGLLIAVGIEGAVTRYEHRKLANEAREMMTAEIRHNAANAKDAVHEIEEQQQKMSHNLEQMAKIQANPKAPEADNAKIDAGYGSTTFEHTAWRTAQATGALSYMPYEQANKFSSIYESIETLEKAEAMSSEDEAQFLGLVRRYEGGTDRLSQEAANAFAERFGIWQGHLLNIHIAARLVQEQQNAFLEGREPQHHMSENITN
jgi:hypothetical protein